MCRLRSLPVEDRRCKFEDENNLELYQSYSHANCKFECYILHALEVINCVPWFLPKKDGTVMCDPWQTQEFLKQFDSTIRCPHCLPDCDTTKFQSSVYAAPFRRCDSRNMGLSPLCNLESSVYPTIWSSQVRTGQGHRNRFKYFAWNEYSSNW